MNFQPRCVVCGQFCKIADCGTPWGNSTMLEPPDDEHFCGRCADQELKLTLKRGYIDCWWIKPTFARVAKSILRHRRKQEKAGLQTRDKTPSHI